MDSSRAEMHTLGQEVAVMPPLFCSKEASGGEQIKMDLALWEINVVLRVELWDTGCQREGRRYNGKVAAIRWKYPVGRGLLANWSD